MQTRVGAISTNKVELSSVFEGHCPVPFWKKGRGNIFTKINFPPTFRQKDRVLRFPFVSTVS